MKQMVYRISLMTLIVFRGFSPYLCHSQGFPTSPLNWPTPSGGLFDAWNVPLGYPYHISTAHAGNNSTQWNTVDITGDGKVDLIETSDYSTGTFIQYGASGAPYWKVYTGNGSGFSTNAVNWATPVGGQYSVVNGNYGFLNTNGQSNMESISQSWQMIDMNNDHLPDLVVTGAYNATAGWPVQFNAGSTPYWKVYMNTGTSFSTSPVNWSTPTGGAYSSAGTALGFYVITGSCNATGNCQYWDLKDMNGDAMPDLVITAQYNTSLSAHMQFGAGSSPYFKVHLNNGSGFNTTPVIWSTPIGGRYLSNTNSVGYVYTYGIYSVCDSSQSWAIADANGDQKPDLVVTGHYNVSTNMAEQYGNGVNPHWRVYLNNGSGFDAVPQIWPTPVGGWYATNGQQMGYNFPQSFGYNWNQGSERWACIDLDGDKRPEFISFSVYDLTLNAYQQYGVGSAPYWKVYYNNGNGFNTWPITWPTPAGGMINQSFINLGFNDEYTFQYTIHGSEGWKLMDMNGDDVSDLLVYSAWDSALYYPVQFGVPGSPHWEVYLNTAVSLAATSPSFNETNVKVYPNPATSSVCLQSTTSLENEFYSIYSVDGRCAVEQKLLPNDMKVNVGALSPGYYLLVLNGKINTRLPFIRN